MSTEARKHLLLVACTIDRVHFVTTWQRPRMATRVMSQLASLPGFDIASHVVTHILPRRIRWLVSAWRVWRGLRQKP